MNIIYQVLRWIFAVLLGMAALGALLTGAFLGALVMLAGCAIIAPPGGAWLASKVSAFQGGLRQVAVGFVCFIVGTVMGMNHDTQSTSTAAKPGAAKPAAAAVAQAPAAPKFQCESGAAAGGEVVGVLGAESHDLHSSPGGEKIVNQKATQILGETQHQVIDNSTKVQVQCIDGDWVRVQITSPEWLTQQKGWVERTALALPLKPGEVRAFTEADFMWDDDTNKAKAAIIKAVNRIHKEDPRCKDDIYPSSVAKSATESEAQGKPVYFVNCGGGATSVNVYFDAQRADDPTPFRAPGHFDKARATDLCEAYAKQQASHPSTVDFSRFMDIAISEHPNGRTTVMSSFKAKNAFNLELKFKIKCLFDESGFIEGQIWEAGS